MSRLKDLLSAQLYLLGWKIVQALPEKSAYRLFEKLGKTLYNRNGKAVQRLRLNLGVVSPASSAVELEGLVVKGISLYFRYWCDTFRFPGWSVEKIRNTVKVTNEHLLKDPVAAGTGVIVALPHSGNWDHAGAYFCAQGIPLVTVAERLKPEILFQKFLKYREAIGMEVLALDSNTLPTLSNRLNEGKLIALVADRDFSKSGVEVDFFSKKAYNTVEKRKAKIITSIAMFYDLEEISPFVADVVECLDDEGIWHFEQSYMPSMLRTNSYDTICHEHLEFYSFKVVKNLLENFGMRVSSIDGGSLRNAIPRESFSTIVIKKNEKERFLLKMKDLIGLIKEEFKALEPNLAIDIIKTDIPNKIMDIATQKVFLKSIHTTLNGVYRMSPDITDLVETSNNIANSIIKSK